ncbi:hypothetical protein SRHO_G00071870 [Serrasalmus rhombeus]
MVIPAGRRAECRVKSSVQPHLRTGFSPQHQSDSNPYRPPGRRAAAVWSNALSHRGTARSARKKGLCVLCRLAALTAPL